MLRIETFYECAWISKRWLDGWMNVNEILYDMIQPNEWINGWIDDG